MMRACHLPISTHHWSCDLTSEVCAWGNAQLFEEEHVMNWGQGIVSRKRRSLFSALMVALVLLSACGVSKGTTSGGASGGNIPIGWVGALSGTNAVLGKWDTNGIQLAFDDKNAKGGVCGQQLQLNKLDDQADPTNAVNASQKLISQNKIVAGFATTNSTSAIAVIPIYQRAKIPQLTGGLSVDITAKGSAYVFRD